MYKEKESVFKNTPKSLEKVILSELGAKSLEEVAKAIENKIWLFKV